MYQSARISVSGFIGKDPVSPIAAKPNYITFSLAMTKKVKDIPDTIWFECYTANMETASYIREKLKKGMGIQVHGIFSSGTYTSKTGEVKNTLKVYIPSREGIDIHMYKTNETVAPEEVYTTKLHIGHRKDIQLGDGGYPKIVSSFEEELDDEIPF